MGWGSVGDFYFDIRGGESFLKTLLIEIYAGYALASLDITNLYSNIPVLETKSVLKNTLEYHQTDPKTQKELIMWYDVITRQNYYIHNRDIISQHDGLAMGVPSSGLIAEFFLQHTENAHGTPSTQAQNH